MKSIGIVFCLFALFSMKIRAQTGCTDSYAQNYSSTATINNGTCVYTSVNCTPTTSTNLNELLKETSGLMEWDDFLYTHNDNTDTSLYKINKVTGAIIRSFQLNSTSNIDWEEIAQDENYLYIGDFGNNASGNRTDLKIYKIAKNTLETNPVIEIINFSYSNQTDFSNKTANTTDFDCEAFIVTDNQIVLFTKQWTSNQTSIYSLPKDPGTYTANLLTTLNVSGLITGATQKKEARLIALCGYSATLTPFLYLIYDYYNTDFAAANKKKIDIVLPYHQVEAISTVNGQDYFITNESFVKAPYLNNPQKLHTINISNYISNYLASLSNDYIVLSKQSIKLYPNPTKGLIFLESLDERANTNYQIVDIFGLELKTGDFQDLMLDISNFKAGVYFLKMQHIQKVFKVIKE